jgi:dienelactone hydrolase
MDGVTFRCSYFQSGGETAAAYLALPEGEGPFPVVVYAPGLRTLAMDSSGYAVALAKKGYAGLLIEEPSLDFSLADARGAIADYVQYGIQGRRALDLLQTMPEIDAQRIGFFGWSNGAILGSLLAGLEDRIKAYVFLGVPLLDDEEFKDVAPGKAAWERYVAQMAALDLAAYVGRNKGAQMLFINGKDDPTAMHAAKAFLAAAPKGATWKVYSGGHGATPAADKYWQAWMLKNL